MGSEGNRSPRGTTIIVEKKPDASATRPRREGFADAFGNSEEFGEKRFTNRTMKPDEFVWPPIGTSLTCGISGVTLILLGGFVSYRTYDNMLGDPPYGVTGIIKYSMILVGSYIASKALPRRRKKAA